MTLNVQLPGESGIRGRTRDVSSSGFGLDCRLPAECGQTVTLELSYPSLIRCLSVCATVEWTDARACGLRSRVVDLERALASALEPRRLSVLVTGSLLGSYEAGHSLSIRRAREIQSARELRLSDAHDVIVVPSTLRDSAGVTLLNELLIGDGARYQGTVVAAAERPTDADLARTLGADVVLESWQLAPWLDTAAQLLNGSARKRICYI